MKSIVQWFLRAWRQESEPPEAAPRPFPPREWLRARLDVDEYDKATPSALSYFKPTQFTCSPEVRERLENLPPMSERPDWQRLKSQMLPGDELWEFSSPGEHWRKLMGRRGIVLIREGQPVDHFITLMN